MLATRSFWMESRRNDVSEVSARYARLSAGFSDKVSQVPPDRWERPSVCEGWTARDIVRHMVNTHSLFLGFVGRELGDIPSVDDDPQGAWEAARGVVQADLDDPEKAKAEFDGQMMGRMTFESGIDRFICVDLVVHAWDLASATGIDDRLDPQDVARTLEAGKGFGEALRSPGACGPALDPPPDADGQTRMLAFFGRRAWS
jgi:uncharacterized protein (TIGR03086 family)